MPDFSHLIETVEPWVVAYGALAVFVILALESLGLPLPGESLLFVAAILAGRGVLSLPALMASAWCAAVLGDNTGYWIGRSLGQAVVTRYGARLGITPDRLARTEAVFAKYGPITVFFARLIIVLRQLNGIVAGTLELAWWKFVLFDALAGAVWVVAWTSAGFYFGAHGSEIAAFVQDLGLIGVCCAVVIVIAILVVIVRARRQNRRGQTGA
jgi:membrane protein DedA with SNARE-associated domain